MLIPDLHFAAVVITGPCVLSNARHFSRIKSFPFSHLVPRPTSTVPRRQSPRFAAVPSSIVPRRQPRASPPVQTSHRPIVNFSPVASMKTRYEVSVFVFARKRVHQQRRAGSAGLKEGDPGDTSPGRLFSFTPRRGFSFPRGKEKWGRRPVDAPSTKGAGTPGPENPRVLSGPTHSPHA